MTDDKQRVLAFEYISDAADFMDDHHRSGTAEAIPANYIFCFPNDDKEAEAGLREAAASFKLSTALTTGAQVTAGTRCTATGVPFMVSRQQIIHSGTGRTKRFGCMASMHGYTKRHENKRKRKSKEQQIEDSTPSNTTKSRVWENTLKFHVASNAGNSAIAHLLSVSNKDGSPESRRICRRWLEFNPSPVKDE